MNIKIFFLILILVSASTPRSQVPSNDKIISPGRPIEREIAGGESHTYQIALQAGQFARFRMDQRAINAALIATAPDGKQLAEMNLTRAGAHESLSLQAPTAGSYKLTVRNSGTGEQIGNYRLEAVVTAGASPRDKQRIAAEALVLEAQELLAKSGAAQQALEKFQQALVIWQELGDAFWSAWTLQRCATAHNSLRQFDKAMESLEQASVLIRQIKHESSEANLLHNTGFIHLRKNQPDKAIPYLEQARALYREVKDPYLEGQSLISLGSAANSLSRFEKAIEYLEEARALFRELKDRLEEGRAIINLGSSHNRLGRSEMALEHYEQALAISRELKNRFEERNALTSLGSAYGSLGQMEKAVDFFEQTLTISREIKDKTGEGKALSNLGLGYFFLSQYERSIANLDQALLISRDVKDRSSEGYTLGHLGGSYSVLGQTEKAIEYHEESLAIFREIKNRYMEGNALQLLWDSYTAQGRHEKAVEYIQQAIAIFQEVKYRVGEANAIAGLARSYQLLDRYEEAIAYNEQALIIHRELKFRPGEAVVLKQMGVAQAKLQRPEKALELYGQSLAIYREVKNRNLEGVLTFDLGEANRQLGRIEQAAALFSESVDMARSVGNRSAEVEALSALARLEGESGNLAQAQTLIEKSLQVAESLRSDLVSSESRAAFLATVQDSYQFYTDLLMRRHRAEPGKGFDALAIEASERQRARSLLDLLTESRTDLRQGVDPVLIERERTLAKQLNDKAQIQPASPEQGTAIKQELNQLETAYERAQVAIRRNNPHYAALTQPRPLKLKEMQAQLDEDSLQLEYGLGKDRSYLWAVTRDSLTSYELPGEEQIKKSALHVYAMLTARNARRAGETQPQQRDRIADADAQLLAASSELSRTILGPASAQLGRKRLVIIPDGALQYIPFAMLPDPVGTDDARSAAYSRPLIVGHEVITQPSASALAIQRTEFGNRQLAAKTLAVIADPVFDRSDARFKVAAAVETASSPASDTRGLEHIADPAAVKGGKLIIRRLPFTRQEADGLLALAPKISTFSAVDFDANRTTVLGGGLSQFRYVHFATHGLLDTERPGLSALVLSTVDADGEPQNGFLRANDIYNMKLPAELVVLSACQTGLGKEVKGEGLIGLTRGFMYAGAKRVVVSLWSVNDKATSDLMTRFYKGMLKNNDRPAAALRAAQIEMWKQKKWQSPYYWAAFTMQGEWR